MDKSAYRPIMTVDGWPFSGRTTVAKKLASEYGVPVIDIKQLHDAALFAICEKLDKDIMTMTYAESAKELPPILNAIDVKVEPGKKTPSLTADGRCIDPNEPTRTGRKMRHSTASDPTIGEWMNCTIRKIADEHGAVIEGRSSGRSTIPYSPVKFFLKASTEERVKRVMLFGGMTGPDLDSDKIRYTIEEEDMVPWGKPQRVADAIFIDTTCLTMAEMTELASLHAASVIRNLIAEK